MLRYCLAFCLLLAPSSGLASEIDGLDSRAADISPNLAFGSVANGREYGIAFASYGGGRLPNGITVQLRGTGGLSPSCTATIGLPRDTVRVSQPALTASGWLIVSATRNPMGDDGWEVYATRRSGGFGPGALSHCYGWTNGWLWLGALDSPVASAPEAVLIDSLTFVFVTDRAHQMRFKFIDESAGPRANWSTSWFALSGVPRESAAWSKPAAAVYNENPTPGAGRNRIHLFWLDSTRRQVIHASATVWPGGYVIYGGAEPRALGDDFGAATARTACAATPENRAPNPLFIVCGNSRGGYSIAHYRNPAFGWNDGRAVERVAGRDWIDRRTYGGDSIPSLGRYPTMFVTVGSRYCPDRPGRQTLPGPTCGIVDRQWLIERRWSPPGVALPRDASGSIPPMPNLIGWSPASSYTAAGPL